jgi:Flp pilus assembly pilin Flp
MLRLWKDDAGIVALEYLLVATIVGLGLVVGLSAFEQAMNTELTELANAILAVDEGYYIAGSQSFASVRSGWNAGGGGVGGVSLGWKQESSAIDFPGFDLEHMGTSTQQLGIQVLPPASLISIP